MVKTQHLSEEQFRRNLTTKGIKTGGKEKAEVVANCDHLQRLKFSPALPYAFTEHGAVMLASVLNSAIAIRTSMLVVRAFIRLREIVAAHKELALKIDRLEKKYDAKFKIVFDAIRQLMEPSAKPHKRIGFIKEDK
jgi:hypothetical protein